MDNPRSLVFWRESKGNYVKEWLQCLDETLVHGTFMFYKGGIHLRRCTAKFANGRVEVESTVSLENDEKKQCQYNYQYNLPGLEVNFDLRTFYTALKNTVFGTHWFQYTIPPISGSYPDFKEKPMVANVILGNKVENEYHLNFPLARDPLNIQNESEACDYTGYAKRILKPNAFDYSRKISISKLKRILKMYYESGCTEIKCYFSANQIILENQDHVVGGGFACTVKAKPIDLEEDPGPDADPDHHPGPNALQLPIDGAKKNPFDTAVITTEILLQTVSKCPSSAYYVEVYFSSYTRKIALSVKLFRGRGRVTYLIHP